MRPEILGAGGGKGRAVERSWGVKLSAQDHDPICVTRKERRVRCYIEILLWAPNSSSTGPMFESADQMDLTKSHSGDTRESYVHLAKLKVGLEKSKPDDNSPDPWPSYNVNAIKLVAWKGGGGLSQITNHIKGLGGFRPHPPLNWVDETKKRGRLVLT